MVVICVGLVMESGVQGNITDEMINNYLDHHKETPASDDNFILEG